MPPPRSTASTPAPRPRIPIPPPTRTRSRSPPLASGPTASSTAASIIVVLSPAAAGTAPFVPGSTGTLPPVSVFSPAVGMRSPRWGWGRRRWWWRHAHHHEMMHWMMRMHSGRRGRRRHRIIHHGIVVSVSHARSHHHGIGYPVHHVLGMHGIVTWRGHQVILHVGIAISPIVPPGFVVGIRSGDCIGTLFVVFVAFPIHFAIGHFLSDDRVETPARCGHAPRVQQRFYPLLYLRLFIFTQGFVPCLARAGGIRIGFVSVNCRAESSLDIYLGCD